MRNVDRALPTAILAIACLLAPGSPAVLEAQSLGESLVRAREALAADSVDAAVAAFDRARGSAAEDPSRWAEISFIAAGELVAFADSDPPPGAGPREAALSRARRIYDEILTVSGDDPRRRIDALNGLAAVSRHLGNPSEAERFEAEAWDGYRSMALTPPYSRAAHDTLVSIATRSGTPAYLGYSWAALQEGRHFDVVDGSLLTLEAAVYDSLQERTILSQLALGLTGDYYDPRTFADGEAGTRLATLSEPHATSTRAGIRTLLEGHASPPEGLLGDGCAPDSATIAAEVERLGWWASDEVPTGPDARSPAYAWERLMVALGGWYDQQAAVQSDDTLKRAAEAYFCMAVFQDPSYLASVGVPATAGAAAALAINPQAAGVQGLRDLSWLYALDDRKDPLERLHEQFQGAFETDPELIPIDQEVVHKKSFLERWAPPIGIIGGGLAILCIADVICGSNNISGTVTVGN